MMSGKLLKRLRISRAAGWISLLAFLLSATPRLACLCPDGNFKPFCLSAVWPNTKCCSREVCSGCSSCSQERKVVSASDGSASLRLPACCRSVMVAISFTGQVHEADCSDRGETSLKISGIGAWPGDSSISRSMAIRGAAKNACPPVNRVIALKRLTI